MGSSDAACGMWTCISTVQARTKSSSAHCVEICCRDLINRLPRDLFFFFWKYVQRSCHQVFYRDLANRALTKISSRDLARRPHKEILHRPCQEISYGDLVRKHCVEICCRDLAKRQRSCQHNSYGNLVRRELLFYRELVRRSHQEILPRDLF